MRMKKFVAPSMGECLLQVKREFGAEAVILDSRKVRRGGAFSFLLGDLIEVVAASDGAGSVRGAGAELSGAGTRQQGGAGAFRVSGAGVIPPTPPLVKGGEGGLSELGPLKGSLALLADDMRGLKETVLAITDHLKFGQLLSLPAGLSVLQRDLLENGVEGRVADSLTQELALQLSGMELEDGQLLRRTLQERIGKIVRVAPLPLKGFQHDPQAGAVGCGDPTARGTGQQGKVGARQVGARHASPLPDGGGGVLGLSGAGTRQQRSWGCRVIAVVGPTGVGKTTTLAKMATHPGIFGGRRVGLVSADTYRMAAVEQLKTFAAIANLPMEAVYRPSDMGRAIARFADREIVLIDTAGRSQNDGSQLRDLAAFLEYAKPDEVHLALSISTRLSDQMDVMAKFQAVLPAGAWARLIFTKLDETTSYGAILNVCAGMANNPPYPPLGKGGTLPISLLTCGQNVPDDVVCPTQTQMVRLVSERGYYQELRAASCEPRVLS